MRYRSVQRKIGYILLFLCITGIVFFSREEECFAEEAKQQVIRVGYPEQAGITERAEDGTYRGYTYDYLMEIKKYTNWDYEFVQVEGTLDEQLQSLLLMLEKGEIDLLGGMVYDENYTEQFDYPGYNYGTSYSILYTSKENSKITSENLYKQPLLRVGVYNRRQQKNKRLEQFAQMSGLAVEQVFASSEEELLKFLSDGIVDAILWKDVTEIAADDLVIVARFAPQPFYFAVTKGKKEIVNSLNMALSMIENINPYFAANLWKEYFSMDNSRLVLSKEEKEYIAAAGVLKAVALGGKAPLQYIDQVERSFRGVSVDLLNYISELTGLEIDLYMTDSFDEYQELIQSGQADLVIGISDEMHQYDWQDILLTMPYLEVSLSLISEKDLDPARVENKNLALSQGVSYDGNYKGKVTYFDTPEDCIQSVRYGNSDYCYMNSYSAQYYVSNYEFRDLATFPLSEEWMQSYSLGIQDPQNTRLISILNKCIQVFRGTDLLQEYLYANAYQQEDVSLRLYLLANFRDVLMSVAVLILSIVVVTLLRLRHKEKQKEYLVRMENERYQLISELSNEYLFEYDIKNNRLKLPDKSADFLKLSKNTDNILERLRKNETFAPFFNTPGDRSEECLAEFGDQTKRWLRVTTKAVFDEKGQMVYLVGKLADIQTEKEEREKLLSKAERDGLTGLFNIAAFRERADQKLAGDSMYMLIILDLDHFKEINDSCGHYTGDFVLSRISDIIQEVFGSDGLCGRLGGDEFVILHPYDGNPETVSGFCEKFLKSLLKIEYTGQKRPVTASVGVAVTEPGLDFNMIYQRADLALYRVKKRGRNGFRVFSEPYLLRGPVG